MMTITYRHFRNIVEDFRTWSWAVSNLGGITLAYREVLTSDESGENEYQIGIAACSNKDNFEFKKGREVATNRLLKNPLTINGEELESLLNCTSSDEVVIGREDMWELVQKIEDHFNLNLLLATDMFATYL